MAPEFLTKDPAEMSEEEIRLAREFQRKEAEFLEEREKLKRSLEAELRKLQDTIRHSMDQFDERLGRLFQLKIGTEMAVHQVSGGTPCPATGYTAGEPTSTIPSHFLSPSLSRSPSPLFLP